MISIKSNNITADIQQNELVEILLRTALFLFIAALLFVLIMYIHLRFTKAKLSREARMSRIFQELLIQYVNTESNELRKGDIILERINSLIKDDEYKEILRRNIVALHKLFVGEIKERIESLYCMLGLYRDTIEMLANGNWSKKLIALNELKEMNLERSRNEVRKLVTNKNTRVSLLAIQTIMDIDKNPFLFLADHHLPISQAQAIFIAKKVSTKKDLRANELLFLFRHHEPSINKLGIQIAQLANLKEAVKYIVPFLQHKEIELQIQAFITLSCLNAPITYRELYEYCNASDSATLNIILSRIDAEYRNIPEPLNQMILSRLAMK